MQLEQREQRETNVKMAQLQAWLYSTVEDNFQHRFYVGITYGKFNWQLNPNFFVSDIHGHWKKTAQGDVNPPFFE